MNMDTRTSYGEPVPPVSQFAVLSFLAAVEGFIDWRGGGEQLRLTLHRITSIEGMLYIQQLVPYLGTGRLGQLGEGRLFPVTTGAMGEAYRCKEIIRTKRYDSLPVLEQDIRADKGDTGDTLDIKSVGLSYLSIPVLGPNSSVVALLYADTRTFNFFADDENVLGIHHLLSNFCKILDELENSPLPRVRNFPVGPGQEVTGAPGVYKRVQEAIRSPPPPQFEQVTSINYEIVA